MSRVHSVVAALVTAYMVTVFSGQHVEWWALLVAAAIGVLWGEGAMRAVREWLQ